MKIIEHLRWDSPQIEALPVSPPCFFCDLLTEPTVLYRDDEGVIRGWKCSRCGFTLPHSHDIHKALSVIRKHNGSSGSYPW
jgi:hypothetical protein